MFLPGLPSSVEPLSSAALPSPASTSPVAALQCLDQLREPQQEQENLCLSWDFCAFYVFCNSCASCVSCASVKRRRALKHIYYIEEAKRHCWCKEALTSLMLLCRLLCGSSLKLSFAWPVPSIACEWTLLWEVLVLCDKGGGAASCVCERILFLASCITCKGSMVCFLCF